MFLNRTKLGKKMGGMGPVTLEPVSTFHQTWYVNMCKYLHTCICIYLRIYAFFFNSIYTYMYICFQTIFMRPFQEGGIRHLAAKIQIFVERTIIHLLFAKWISLSKVSSKKTLSVCWGNCEKRQHNVFQINLSSLKCNIEPPFLSTTINVE